MTSADSGSDAPRVSVVIPNFPDAVLIEETLRSIQEDEVVEVVVVDDASPVSGTVERLTELQTEGLIDVLHVLPVNRGHQAAINEGVARSRGRYVYILGNDDLLVPGALSKLANALDRAPEDTVFACGSYERFGAAGGIYTPPSWDPWRLLFMSPWPGSYMVRRTALDQVDGVQANSMFEDWDTYMAYAEQGFGGVVVEGVVYRYRIHDQTRLSAKGQREYRAQYDRLRTAHADLFARRQELRAASPAAWWYKFALPTYFFIRLRTPRRVIAMAHRIAFR